MYYIFLETIISKMEKNDTIKKYSNSLNIDILESIDYKQKLHHFSWSIYCTHISNVANTEPLDLDTLYAVELLGLTAMLIDDGLDKDTDLFQKSGTDYLFLLSTELLVESLEIFKKSPLFDYGLLKAALHAEFKDFTTILNGEKLTLDFYFEEILPKSAAIFQLFTKLASSSDSHLNKFAIHYGNYIQIINDISDFLSNCSSDIPLLKSSLPLLLGVNTLDLKRNKKILHSLKNNENLVTIRKKIIATGALDFSQQLMEIEKKRALSALNNISFSNHLTRLKYYLELE